MNLLNYFVFLHFQLDGSQKFEIATPRLGYVSISTVLDFEALNALGQTTYILNISATVSDVLGEKI